MSEKNKPNNDLAAVIKSLKGYLLEKGHRFERGPHYEWPKPDLLQRGGDGATV